MDKALYLFPFNSIRNYQDRLIKIVDESINAGKVLIAHAPTGLGKTVSALGPALKHALTNKSTIFFLTPKHTQHRIVVETIKKIKEAYSISIQTTDLIGRKWMCGLPVSRDLSTSELNDLCYDLKKDDKCEHYNNFRGKELKQGAKELLDKLKGLSPIHVEDHCRVCNDCKICAYEAAMELARKSKVIICDYYHIFNERVRQAFLSRAGKELSNSIIVIDEAQNLPDRIRELMSSQLSSFTIKASIKELREAGFTEDALDVSRLLELFDKYLQSNDDELFIKRDDLINSINSFTDYDELIARLVKASDVIREEKKKSYSSAVALFLSAWQGKESHYARVFNKKVSKSGRTFGLLNYNCLDPSVYSKPVFDECKSAVLMSGTLTPTDMYAELLGINDPVKIELPSPFPRDNQLNIIVPETTTRYTKRNDDQYKAIANKLTSMLNAVSVNTAVFFPSYALLKNVLKHLNLNRHIIVEQQGLSKEDKTALFNNFTSHDGSVLFGVVSGSFSEGVDYPGNSLKCIIIVGVPLQTPDLYTKSLIDYYDNKFGRGWDYGYLFPAMTKVIQSAGRSIRSGTDRGVIVFLDERFAWRNYLKCIPPEWLLK